MTELQLRRAEIEAIELSEEEVREALWTAKVVKWQRERNREYWKSLEIKKDDKGIYSTSRKPGN